AFQRGYRVGEDLPHRFLIFSPSDEYRRHWFVPNAGTRHGQGERKKTRCDASTAGLAENTVRMVWMVWLVRRAGLLPRRYGQENRRCDASIAVPAENMVRIVWMVWRHARFDRDLIVKDRR
ncbi:MAG: hypothetical protein ACXW3O_15665, partial [Brevundimonas sp.]